MMKHLTLSRGAAAALLFTSVAPVLGAQGTEPVRARSHDSVFVRMFGAPSILMDSLKVLIRAYEREPYGSADYLAITRRIDSLLMSRKPAFATRRLEPRFGPGTMPAIAPTGWLGFVTQGPSEQIFDRTGQHVIYFAYPSILSVDPNSPAEKAGIAPGDLLIAYNGQDVINHDFNLTQLLRPETKVGITVRRDDETKEYSVIVARGPQGIEKRRKELEATMTTGRMRIERVGPDGPIPSEAPRVGPRGEGAVRLPGRAGIVPGEPSPGARMLVMSMNGMFGASLSAVSAELAKALRLKTGVLVTEAPEETPAWRAGLRAGDVIVSVEDEPVFSVNEFRDRVLTRLQQRAVALQVVRNQRPRTVTLTWSSP